MNKGMRWRILTLQAILVLVLGGAGTFMLVEGNFVNQTIHDQLAPQQIFFPAASTIVAGGALDPAVFPAEIRAQAGNQVLTGEQARIYAQDFIGVHLQKIANGKTYSQIDTKSGTPAENAAATAQKTTLFQGESLKNMLLNAWGWSKLASYTILGGYALLLASLVTLGAFLFEIVIAREPADDKLPRRKAATVVPAL